MTDESEPDDSVKKPLQFEKLAIESIMSSENGRAYLMSLLDTLGVFSNVFSTDSHNNAFNMGVRSVGINLQADLMQYTPDMYLKMIKEYTDE